MIGGTRLEQAGGAAGGDLHVVLRAEGDPPHLPANF